VSAAFRDKVRVGRMERRIVVAVVEEHAYGYTKEGKAKTHTMATTVDGKGVCKGIALGCVRSSDQWSDVEERQSVCVPDSPDLSWTKSWTLDDKHLQTRPSSQRSTAAGRRQTSSGGVKSPVPSVHLKQNTSEAKRFFDHSAPFGPRDP
jgi:hypothetical protein